MKTLSQIRELISEKKKHKEEMCDDCGKASKVCGCSDMKEEKELSAKQKKIAAITGDKDKIDAEDLAKLRSMKKEEAEQVDEGGMPSSVIKSKQAREKMSPEDLHAHVKSLKAKGGPIFGGKSVEHIAREMAWSHGHGKMSPHYWDKIKHLEPKNEAKLPPLHKRTGNQQIAHDLGLDQEYSQKYPGGEKQRTKDKAAFLKRFPPPKNEEVEQVDEVAPPGWEGTVKAMKKHKGIDNPWALAWSMKNKGMKSHKKD
jgi:hypothetical protein